MAVESVSGYLWNECPDQRGISVRMLVEWVSGWSWNPQFATWFKLARRSARLATQAHLLLSLAGRIGRGTGGVTAKLTTNGRGAAIKHPGDRSLAQALKLAELDRDAFFYRFKSVSELLEAVA
ncbi:hypothetical protein BR1R5_02890 [Pseudomonas sp. BR1R-5]|nr:hypothetical protein BR1R5_02890 [Pseudomonas sp. BR1R-5]